MVLLTEQPTARPGIIRATETVGGHRPVAAQRSGLERRDGAVDRGPQDQRAVSRQAAAQPPLPPPMPTTIPSAITVAAPTIPSAPLGATTSNSPNSGEAPALWNPKWLGAWSLLFSWAFGAFLLARNWKTLGEPPGQDVAMVWFYAFLPFLAWTSSINTWIFAFTVSLVHWIRALGNPALYSFSSHVSSSVLWKPSCR